MRYVDQEELPLDVPPLRPDSTGSRSASMRQAEPWVPTQRPTGARPIYSESYRRNHAAESDRFESKKQQLLEEREPSVPPPPTEPPWHERLIHRFFSVPERVDPLKRNGRLYLVLAFFLLALLLVVGKLFKIQVLDHGELSEQAASQYQMQVTIPAKRGIIHDRNGIILAANAFVFRFAVDPQSVQNKSLLASELSRALGKPASFYLSVFKDTSRRYIVLAREVPLETATLLDSVKDHGLIREMESRRTYAFDDRASHILGFTSNDGRGLAGIELSENKALAGHDGFQIMQRDGRGRLRPDVDYERVPAVDGEDVTLTIDESIQSIVETALKAGVAKADAEAGIAIVMNPKTGEILALANFPDFNPNDYEHATFDMLRDRAITDAYEPGSTMKLITACAALEDHAWKPDDKINAEHGRWEPEPGVRISDTHDYSVLTFRQALEKSSNICFAKISDRLNPRRFYKYMRDFGLGNYTGIDLPGEVCGVLHKPNVWGKNSKRYMAFGYELTATPLQMVTAYATVANMGVMMRPYVVASRTTANGTVETEPQEIRRVVSVQTAKTMLQLLTGVVDSGTATLCRIKGVQIAGKTGTAQQLVDGHWSKSHYTASFTGMFPADHPNYVISVVLRSPHNGYYGGTVSGPIFREIAMGIMERDGTLPVEARTQPQQTTSAVDEGVVEIEGTVLDAHDEDHRDIPEVRGLTADAGRELLASQGFAIVGARQDGIIEKIQECGRDSVRLILSSIQESRALQKPREIPDMTGMPMARAIKLAAAEGLRVRAVGAGNVKKQFPVAGETVKAEPGQSPIVTLFGEE